MKRLFLDYEVFSPVDVRRGVDAHASAPGAQVILACFAWGDGEVVDVDPATESGMRDVRRALREADEVVAHNAWYENFVTKALIDRSAGIEWHCTMARAYAHSLPGSLDQLCKTLGVPQDLAKKDGKKLIRLFCAPQPRTGKRIYQSDRPEEWARFVEYGRADITALREVYERMPMVNYRGFEKELWKIDQQINMAGIPIDRTLAKRAVAACQKEKAELDEHISDMTLGAVTSGTQRERVKDALESYGVVLDDLKASTIEAAASDKELAAEARSLIEARQAVSLSSTAKYKKLLEAVGSDGRLRGALQFSGAGRTRRWAGRIFQPHNLPRPSRKQDEVDAVVEALLDGSYDLIDDNVHRMCSDAIRSVVRAEEGNKLVVADYSSIEGRVLAWLAGEQWKLDAYARGVDMYVATYNAVFGLPKDNEIDKEQRQHGKVFELSLGYEGGVGALVTMASGYGVDLSAVAKAAWQGAPQPIRAYAEKLLAYAKMRPEGARLVRELGGNVYRGLECAKLMWRAAAPETARLWGLYDEAAKLAMTCPGEVFKAGRCKFVMKAGALAIRLPSGGVLFYYGPKLTDDGITYTGTYGGRVNTYGGKLTENITQAVARDILAEALERAWNAGGFRIILHVHDEIIAEQPKTDTHALERLIKCMCVAPSWASGLPLDGSGYEAERYRKD
ncbi:DNA polymerase [uncultured Halomonas sp.]|uniref:DNA polymerase n=1 Tax=uncultured Halomonas sp. TaxID=173971 RepID=UPI00262B50FB|nr:DNA polymerase [uncultured Halomonas sp.]